MKKLSKKQQLIILISIITIIVIIGIIIGANIIRTNIANGNYNSSNENSNNNNLLPEYIKAGITLGGVTGTLEDLDTSDATATADPNVESNWHNATSQEMTANGTIYARLTNGTKSGGYTSYEVWNIDKTPIGTERGTISISRSNSTYELILSCAAIDEESGVAKVIIYYKSEINSAYYSKEYDLATINGVNKGESRFILSSNNRFQLTKEEVVGHELYAYWEAYDVAGNKSISLLAWISADGRETSYTPQ